jgi:hypothetical protein
MKLNFDIKKSLEECPPEKRYMRKEIRDDVEFVARVELPLDKVSYRRKDQVRIKEVDMDAVGFLKESLFTHGFIHTEYPPVIIEDSDKPGYYDGESGFNRNAACIALGQDTFLFDVYRFKSPYALWVYKSISNHTFTPQKGNTKEDLAQQIVMAIDQNLFVDTDVEIKRQIDIIAADKSEKERKNIFKLVRSFKGEYSHLKTYHAGTGIRSTTEAAKKFNLAHEGEKNLAATGKFGYIPPQASPVTAFAGSRKLIAKYGYRPIEFTLFIPSPLPEPQLTKQREERLELFNKQKDIEAKYLKVMMEQFGLDVSLQDILSKLPQYTNGFLPQHENPDPKKGGRPTEETIVDVNGRPVKNTEQRKFTVVGPITSEPSNLLNFGTN